MTCRQFVNSTSNVNNRFSITNEKELSLVTNTIESVNDIIYKITLENNEVIKSTEKHQYFVLDKGWVRAYI